jgi:hypothetical protein
MAVSPPTRRYTRKSSTSGLSGKSGVVSNWKPTLNLDFSQPLPLGPELVTNGDFSNGTTGWVSGSFASLSVVGGALRVTNGAANFGFASQGFPTVVGRTYAISSFYVGSVPTNTANYHVGTSLGGNQNITSANAAFPNTLVATATTTYISVYAGSNAESNYTDYDNISVREYQVTFTRADASTCATYFDSSGVLRTAAANIPRIDYDPATLVCKGLLIEESRANLLLHSRDVTQAAWGKSDVTTTRNQIGIDGVASTACLITEGSAGTAYHLQGVAVSAGATITVSVYIKRSNTDWVSINAVDPAFNGGAGWFNLLTGVVGATAANGTGTSVSSSMIPAGNGWFRCSVTSIPSGAYTTGRIQLQSATGNSSYTRVSGATYILDAAQVEVGAFPTSPIITTAAAVTRAADVSSMTGTNFSSWFNASAGSFVAEFTPNNITANYRIVAYNTPNAFLSQATGTKKVNFYDGAVNETLADSGTFVGVRNVAAAAYSNNKSVVLNGGAVVNGAFGTGPPSGATELRFGPADGGAPVFTGHIRSLRYYPKRLSDAELRNLTK